MMNEEFREFIIFPSTKKNENSIVQSLIPATRTRTVTIPATIASASQSLIPATRTRTITIPATITSASQSLIPATRTRTISIPATIASASANSLASANDVFPSTSSNLNASRNASEVSETWNWTINQTKVLLDLYKMHRKKVGSFEVRNLKKLWELLAREVNKILKSNVSPNHCENRWRVLERAYYKKCIDNQNKTGQGKKYFEYLEEMEAIFKGKKNIRPEALLGNETIEKMPEDESEDELSKSLPATSVKLSAKQKLDLKRKRNPVINRNITLEQMRQDRKMYHEKE